MSIFKVESTTLDYLYKAKEKITKELIKMDKQKLLAQLEFVKRLEIALDELVDAIDELEK